MATPDKPYILMTSFEKDRNGPKSAFSRIDDKTVFRIAVLVLILIIIAIATL